MPAPLAPPEWQTNYQAALREYGLELSDQTLQRGIASCMMSLADLPLDAKSCGKRRSCLAALSDLLVLRTLHYKYKRLRIAQG
jgi:hypothetical protein